MTRCIFTDLSACCNSNHVRLLLFFFPSQKLFRSNMQTSEALGLVSSQQHVFIYWTTSRSIAQISNTPPTPTSNVCRWTHMATVGSKKDPVKHSPRCNKTCWSVRSHPSIFTPESISWWDETLLYGMNKRIRWEERSSCEGVSKWVCRFVSEGQRSQRRCIKGKEDGECIHVQSDPSWSTCGWGGWDLCNMFSIT